MCKNKKQFFLVFFLFLISQVTFAMGNSHSDDSQTQNNVNVDQAKRDYQIFLQQLKVLNSQYQQVTGQMKQVIKEEGVPVWDDKTGGITVTHDLDSLNSDLVNVPVEEKETEMIVRLELPGLQKNSIQVSIVEKKELDVAAKRKIPDDRGDIHQRIALPSLAKEKGAKASYVDGILTVSVPKESPSKNPIAVPVN